jgi:hypothetical protein
VILRNLKDVSWAGAKSMMADPAFLKSLVEFDKDGLSDKQASAGLVCGVAGPLRVRKASARICCCACCAVGCDYLGVPLLVWGV